MYNYFFCFFDFSNNEMFKFSQSKFHLITWNEKNWFVFIHFFG